MIRQGGNRPTVQEVLLTDEEFEQIQREHYNKKKGPEKRSRSEKSLISCLEAIRAFKVITGLQPITVATADDCAAFQEKALKMPKNTIRPYPKGRKEPGFYSPNTVIKWSVALQAAWERASKNSGKKCVRGVVCEAKLLKENPWKQFTWIEGFVPPIRQYDAGELMSLLDFLDEKWKAVTVASSLAKVFLWSGARRAEVTALTWTQERMVGNEHHFQVVGKWAVKKWFRVPDGLYQELQALRTQSPFVFAAYNRQLKDHYRQSTRPGTTKAVDDDFQPEAIGSWFYNRIVDWSANQPRGKAYIHVFRKTSLQYARRGEDANHQLAKDARVSERVMMSHYVEEGDPELREASNRMYDRLLASLPPAVAKRYGYVAPAASTMEEQLATAMMARDWKLVAEISAKMAQERG
jgi:integrase